MAGQPQDPSWTQSGQAYSQPPADGAQQGYQHPEQQYPEQQYQVPSYERAPSYEAPPSQQAYGQQGQGQGYPGYEQTRVPGATGPRPGGQAREQGADHAQWQLPTQDARRPQPRPKSQERGFVGSLFDFGFRSFVTPKIIKVLYVLVTIWTVLWALVFLDIGFRTGGVAGGLATLIIVDPLLILVSLGVFRVVLEFFMVTFRMQEDLRSLRDSASERSSAAPRSADGSGQDYPGAGI